MSKRNILRLIGVLIAISILSMMVGACGQFGGNKGLVFPQPESLIVIDIDTYGYALPETKDKGALNVSIKMTVDKVVKKTLGKIKVQGSSTAKWPKKNWTLSFYKDKDREKSLDVKIGKSIASDQWIAKAEWIDPSLLRNGLSYRLWESMVESRQGSPKNEVEIAYEKAGSNIPRERHAGAQAFPVTHPAQILINGEHYGLAMLTLGHDPRNFNIDKENPKHLYMEFDARGGYTSTKTWEKFKSEGIGEWIDGYYPENEDMNIEQIEAIETLGRFINSPLDEFKANFNRHLDKTNMIDMLLFLEMIYDYDAVAQDIEIFTYDLQNWYMLPWDKDTTFGMDWNMKGILVGSETTLLIDYSKENPEQIPWYKTYKCFKEQVEERYAQLRRDGVFTAENIGRLADDILGKIPDEAWEAELKKWEAHDRLPIDVVGKEQILSWFEQRLTVLDKQFAYNKTAI